MASSSSKRRRSYDVFLSFRGTDVRNNFLGHLYSALDQSGLYTYMDSEELRKGEQISPALMEAIEESRIAIVVFSYNYASSTWCLDELAKIMECKGQRDLIVIPVFYKVDPKEVRTPRVEYAQAMAKHEVKFEKEPEKVMRWKKALFDAGNLSGEHITEDTYEAGVTQHIVQEISTQLNRTPLKVPKYLVGIDSRVQELKECLNLQSKDGVLIIGLWGQGGVGKTTLAKAIFNIVFREFQGSSFLEGVKENSQDLVPLQKQLLSDVLRNEVSTSFGVSRGSQLIQERLFNKRVLIILDDVDHRCQLDDLVGDCKWLREGSRIIITTRDKRLIKFEGPCYVHEVKALQATEASELLRMHAFPRNQQINIRTDLIDSVLQYAQGLPLALEVVGSSLCDAGEEEWESTLHKLARYPSKEINHVLKVGFEKLDKEEQEIFLDIACFFKGWSTSNVKKILDGCGFAAAIGLRTLIERTLIREEGKTLQMHDLIQLMGRDIVKENCNDPGKQSRLWLYDDVLNVVSGDVVTYAVQAIVLKLPEPEEMHIGPYAFLNMKKLRLLILHNVHNSFLDPIHLPIELRWFEWPHCASFPKFSGGRNKLVGLCMQNSKIEVGMEQFKAFGMLKYINFSRCDFLTRIPDLSSSPSLESLDLSECKSLVEVHQSVGHLDKLKFLSLYFCSNLSIFPSELKTKSLQKLDLLGCSRLEEFPDILEKMVHLETLTLDQMAIEELPPSIVNLVIVKSLDLGNCKNLTRLPPSIYKLRNLQYLTLQGCSNFSMFPKNLEDSTDPDGALGFPNLENLHLGQTAIEELSPSTVNLVSVKWLCLRNCKNLARLPPSIYKLQNLEALDLEGCSNLSMFPKNLEDSIDTDGVLGFPNLTNLNLKGCSLSELEFLEGSSNFPKLGTLNLGENKFTHLRINDCYNIEYLYLNDCKQLLEIPQLPSNIGVIQANNCRSLQKLPDFSSLSNLSEVYFSSCRGLLWKGFDLPGLSILKYLRETGRTILQPEIIINGDEMPEILLTGDELPEWILHCKEGAISFMVPKDLYDKFLALALCVVLEAEEGKVVDFSCEVQMFVNGKRVTSRIRGFYSLESNNIWLKLLTPFEVVKSLQKNWSHFQVCLRVSNASIKIKKLGFRLICRQQEDDLKVILHPPQPIETDWMIEERDLEEDHSIDTKKEDSPVEMDEEES